MNAILSVTKRAFRTFADAKSSWLSALRGGLIALEKVRLPSRRPDRDLDELEHLLALEAFAGARLEGDVFASRGQARLAVDCTLAGDRCHDPSRSFIEMDYAESPLRRLRGTLGQFRLGGRSARPHAG